MSLLLKKSESKKSEPVPAGTHHAICYGVVDLGTQAPLNPAYKPAHKLLFLWEIPEERIKYSKDGKDMEGPRVISREFNVSLGSDTKPTKLRTFLEGWRGRKFTEAELGGFDIKNIIGANCLLNVTHTAKGDKTYANAESANPLMKGMVKKNPETETIYFDLSGFTSAEEVMFPDSMPAWIQEKIKKSEEYQKLLNGAAEAEPETEAGPGDAADESGGDNMPF